VAQGPQAFANDEALVRHASACAQCFDLLAATTAANTHDLASPADAPGTTAADGVGSARERVEFRRSLQRRSGRLVPLLVGTAALVIAALGARTVGHIRREPRRITRASLPQSAQEEKAPPWLQTESSERRDGRTNDAATSSGRRDRGMLAGATSNRFGIEGPVGGREPQLTREAAKAAAASSGIVGILRSQIGSSSPYAPTAHDSAEALSALLGDPSSLGSGTISLSGLSLAPVGARREGGQAGLAGGASRAPMQRRAADAREHAPASDRPSWMLRDNTPNAEHATQLPRASPLAAAARYARTTRAAVPPAPTHQSSPQPARPPTNAAEELLAHYSQLDGVKFIDANGYFANTYVPGDPELRVLQARLRSYDRTSLLPQRLRTARFDDAARRNTEPFDPPDGSALAVYVSASERAITGAQRMLVQVGLQATSRHSGQRPAMNIGLVLDARVAPDAATSGELRALLAAFADARDRNDKISLFAAGPGGGLLVSPDAFRHGPLTVALQRLTQAGPERGAASVSLPDALQRALASVRGDDDPNAPLGSSVVIVITPDALGAELSELASLAQQSAATGVPVSVFGLGARADAQQNGQLALAGHGNRRTIGNAAEAAQAVDHELSAVARVVAHAVRLRICLAPGVHLVSVLGSHALDDMDSTRVREAESSIDQRVSNDLGVARDRGDDEPGVQIVIPSFYAGDAHTVLLDVVADGPGPIVDVTARYKDLVQLSNRSARQSLWLPNLELAPGALQRNVLKNLIAYELAQQLTAAGDALAKGANGPAIQLRLGHTLAMLDSLGHAIPELLGDRELEQDRVLTAEYYALLGQVERAAQLEFAADSLHFAGLLKMQPRPEWDARATAVP
jgi:hypothetical protein